MNVIIITRNIKREYIDLDNAIDAEVYKSKIRCGGLCGLTEEEIKIVEGRKL